MAITRLFIIIFLFICKACRVLSLDTNYIHATRCAERCSKKNAPSNANKNFFFRITVKIYVLFALK